MLVLAIVHMGCLALLIEVVHRAPIVDEPRLR